MFWMGLKRNFLNRYIMNEKIQNLCDEGPAFKGYQGLIGQGCRLLSECDFAVLQHAQEQVGRHKDQKQAGDEP